MTVEEMLADLYQEFSHPIPAPPAIRSQFLAHLNRAHRAILREPGLERLRPTFAPLTFTAEVGRAYYGLPATITRVTAITERDNDRVLPLRDLHWLRRADPGLTASGTPECVIPLGFRPIQRPPATTGVWVASTAAVDTTQTLYMNAVRASGLATGDLTAQLNGLTRVPVTPIADFVDITSVVLNASAGGNVSLYDAAVGGHLLAEIPFGQVEPKYFAVQLYPAPAAPSVYYVDGVMTIVPLGERDTPMLPDEFHDLLPAYARMREYEYKGDNTRFQAAFREYSLGLGRLKLAVNGHPAEVYVLGQPSSGRYSREGPWTPATWPED